MSKLPQPLTLDHSNLHPKPCLTVVIVSNCVTKTNGQDFATTGLGVSVVILANRSLIGICIELLAKIFGKVHDQGQEVVEHTLVIGFWLLNTGR
jgi:hypothetical protein